MFLRLLKPLAFVCLISGFGSGGAHAEELRYATGFGPNSTGVDAANIFAEKITEMSNGDLTIRVFPQSLLSFTEMSPGVRDGLADIGMVLFPYFPGEYPSMTMVSEMTMAFALEDNSDFRAGLAWNGVLIEYVTLNCPTCLDELAAQNQVFTSTSATEYTMMCSMPVRTLDDMKGLRIRAPGAHWTRWAQSLGATAVAIPQNEIFEGLSQGILDCSLNGMAELVDLGLIDAVKYIVTDIPGGGFGGTAQGNVNGDVWNGLTAEKRKILLQTSTIHGSMNSWMYRENNAEALEAAKERGIEIITPDRELIEATKTFILSDLQNVAKTYSDRYGLADTHQSVDTVLALFEKWRGLMKSVNSGEEMGEVIWNEVLSKIDVETYGMK